jgi:hypothetical protein
MPSLSNRQFPLLGYGVFTPICGAPVAAARGPRLLRASTNRNQLDETYSILRYSGEISYRFIAAFRGAENSSEAIRSISLFNLRLSTSCRTVASFSFVLIIAVCSFAAYSHYVDRVYMGSSPHRFRPNFGRHWAFLTPPVQPRDRKAKPLPSSIERDIPRSSKPR